MHGIAQIARQHGSETLVAPFVPGPRNGMFRDFLIRSGFREVESNLWTIGLADLPHFPQHVDFHGPERIRAAAD